LYHTLRKKFHLGDPHSTQHRLEEGFFAKVQKFEGLKRIDQTQLQKMSMSKIDIEEAEPRDDEIEVEEGEIVPSDFDDDVSDGDISISDDDISDDDLLEDEFDEDELAEFDDASDDALELMERVLTTESGDTVASALVDIASQLETQNRILIKIFAALQN